MSEQETAIQPYPRKSIWSAGQVGVICIIFSFLAAGMMNAISYGRLGDTRKKIKTIWGVIIVFIVLIIAGVLTPASYSPVFTGFHVGTVFYFFNDQKKLYERYQSSGEMKKAGIALPIILIIVGWLILLFVLGNILYLFDLKL